MLTEAELQKKWESLTFTDNFIFSRVMHDEHICRQVVELILGVRIGEKFSPGFLGGEPLSGAGKGWGFRGRKTPLPSRGLSFP